MMAVRFEHLDAGERLRKSRRWLCGWQKRIEPGDIDGYREHLPIWVTRKTLGSSKTYRSGSASRTSNRVLKSFEGWSMWKTEIGGPGPRRRRRLRIATC